MSERAYISIHQISQNLVPLTKLSTYQISKGRIIVGRVISKNNIDYVKAQSGREEDLILELNQLVPGNYIAFL